MRPQGAFLGDYFLHTKRDLVKAKRLGLDLEYLDLYPGNMQTIMHHSAFDDNDRRETSFIHEQLTSGIHKEHNRVYSKGSLASQIETFWSVL